MKRTAIFVAALMIDLLAASTIQAGADNRAQTGQEGQEAVAWI